MALIARNVIIEPMPQGGGKRSRYYISPLPGRALRATPSSGKLIRGIFSRPGVCSSDLFVAAGSSLYKISSSSTWTATLVGVIQGATGTVLFDSVGANLVILAGGVIYKYDGTTLSINVDPDCPLNAYTLACLGERVLTSQQSSDTFSWSAVDDPTDWPASGFAASARLPDEIRAQVVVNGELWSFGANSAQVWRAIGGEDDSAFDIIDVVIDRGIAGRDAIAHVDNSVLWVGDDRVIYTLNGYSPVRVVNRAVEQALAQLSDDELASIQCFSHNIGAHYFWVMRMPSGVSYAYDTLTQQWQERSTWGATRYAISYATTFDGYSVVASDESDKIWTWDQGTFSDNSATDSAHEHVMMVHVPVTARTIISRLCLDIKAMSQPLTGQGSDPIALVTFYNDGGSLDSIHTRGVERPVSLGQRGAYDVRPVLHRLGMANAADGILVKVRILDPIDYTFSGVWIQENPT